MESNDSFIWQYREIFDNDIQFKKVHLWIEVRYSYNYELEDDIYNNIIDFVDSIIARSDTESLLYFIKEHKHNMLAYLYFLQKSIDKKSFKIFQFLINQPLDTDYDYLLEKSIRLSEPMFVEELVKKVTNVNVHIPGNWTYDSTFLSLSVEKSEFYNDQSLISDLLLNRGADPYLDLRTLSARQYPGIFTDEISHIINIVNHKRNLELLKVFLNHGVDIKYFSLGKFLARNNFDIEVLNIFLKYDYDVTNFFDDYDFGFKRHELLEQVESFLSDAPMEIIRPIISNANILGKYDIKLLYYSAMANRLDVVKLLVTLGANVQLLHPRSMAEFYFAGAPEYRTFTVLLNNEDTIAKKWYSNDRIDFHYWDIKSYDDLSQEKNIDKMVISLLKSFSNIIVQHLVSHGAPTEWNNDLQKVLKSMILKRHYAEG